MKRRSSKIKNKRKRIGKYQTNIQENLTRLYQKIEIHEKNDSKKKAKNVVLEAMKNQESAYLQQNRRKATKPRIEESRIGRGKLKDCKIPKIRRLKNSRIPIFLIFLILQSKSKRNF